MKIHHAGYTCTIAKDFGTRATYSFTISDGACSWVEAMFDVCDGAVGDDFGVMGRIVIERHVAGKFKSLPS